MAYTPLSSLASLCPEAAGDPLDDFVSAGFDGLIGNVHSGEATSPTHLASGSLSGRQIGALFDRPFLGGMERLGPLSTGPADAVRAEARAAIETGPETMILGADCTLAADAPWKNIAAATEVAHAGGGRG